MGTVSDTAPHESITVPVVRAEPNKDNTTWIATKMVGTLNVLNMICVLRSRWASGFRVASEHRVLFGATLVVECVVPDLLHVMPVRHDNMLDGILLRQDTALAPSLVTDMTTFLHADQNALHLGTANDG